ERSKATVLKTVASQDAGGSNPSSSAQRSWPLLPSDNRIANTRTHAKCANARRGCLDGPESDPHRRCTGLAFTDPPWRGDREAEGTRLLSERRSKAYRGFESRPLRRPRTMH